MKRWLDTLRRRFRPPPQPLSAEAKRRAKRQAKRERVALLLSSEASRDGLPALANMEIHTACGDAERDAVLRATRAPLVLMESGEIWPQAGELGELISRLATTPNEATLQLPGKAPLWRRDALLQVGGLAQGLETARARMTQLGWRLPGVAPGAPAQMPREHLTSTLFLSLSGRAWAWPLTTRFLESEASLHPKTHLSILDTSGSPEFSSGVRSWLADCPFAETAYRTLPPAETGLADRARPDVLDEVRHYVAAIYNTFARTSDTELALFLEDDVVPPPGAYTRLASLLTGDVASASAVVRGRHERYRRGEPIAWRWDSAGERENLALGSGVQPIGGSGFGCTAVRGGIIRDAVFRSGPPWDDFDFNFFHDLVAVQGRKAVIDWDCVCRHHDTAKEWV